jgi:hypothetical protein
MKDETKIETKSEWGKEESIPKNWQWSLCGLFIPISVPLLYLGIFIAKISNFLMFDTHHLEIRLTPKKYNSN